MTNKIKVDSNYVWLTLAGVGASAFTWWMMKSNAALLTGGAVITAVSAWMCLMPHRDVWQLGTSPYLLIFVFGMACMHTGGRALAAKYVDSHDSPLAAVALMRRFI